MGGRAEIRLSGPSWSGVSKISIFDLTERAAVLEAMRRCDALGRDEFLRVHQYGPARSYFVLHEGREYDSKAIAGVAYGLQHGVQVTPDQFSGGHETVARALERLGFEVRRAESWGPNTRAAVTRSVETWDADEMLLVLHWYLRFPSETLDAEHPAVLALSRTLQRRAVARGRPEEAREPVDVAAQLAGFGAIDPDHGHGIGAPPSRAHVDAWARWVRDDGARRRKVEALLGDLDGAGTDQDRTTRRQRLEEAWGAAERPVVYRAQTKHRTTEPQTPAVPAVALLAPHQGPRRVAPRTAAEPRVEDASAYDRAHEAHESVRTALARLLEEHGFSVYDASSVASEHDVDFDLAADDGELRLVVEAKSLPADPNAHAARLRMGLGQVIWYRHRFVAVCGEPRVAVLVVERAPRDPDDWLAACRDVGVVLTWPERFGWLVEECRCARVRG